MSWLTFACAFLLAGFLWVPVGLLLASLLRAAGEADERAEETHRRMRSKS